MSCALLKNLLISCLRRSYTVKFRNWKRRQEKNQDEIDGNQWSRFGQRVEGLDEEERWMNYAEQALAMLNHEVMWQAIVEACKILKYPEPSETQRDYFETLFDMSCFVWHQIYSEFERTVPLNNLVDYISCVCNLKYNSTI
jgi:hypothetical protein